MKLYSERRTIVLNLPYKIELVSSGGLALKSGKTEITANLVNSKNGEQIVSPTGAFTWKRLEDPDTFATKTGKTVEITETDLSGDSSTFTCSYHEDGNWWSVTENITIAKSIKGEDGSSYTVLIHSTNGNVFRFPNISTTLSVQVLENENDITGELEEWRFNWKRVSSDGAGDENWNTSSKAIGKKSVDITGEDCNGRTVFIVEVELADGVTIQSS